MQERRMTAYIAYVFSDHLLRFISHYVLIRRRLICVIFLTQLCQVMYDVISFGSRYFITSFSELHRLV